LAGSASGLGATIQILIGGILAFITGYVTSIIVSPIPLIMILLITIIVSMTFSYILIRSNQH
jgi:ABC-type Fe3+-siderophore transport system permease subunit